ncbi:MAG TPA: 16S rRNA (guanine(966)-N(2))-methyltransferase RsmD [Thermoanaerobaculia bacterium]|nr:16S rRNA (guanine(966)-N(2))-methyltransferase RsmD [Thermoanaerobaculia bacterium]
MKLRIAGGGWRGRVLEAAPDSRPTQERVREALFSAWSPRLPGARVLDLFAGAGLVGLEALSRGAAFCGFVDHRDAALRALAANAARLGIEVASARLDLRRGLAELPAEWGTRFDLIFADPPYDYQGYDALVDAVASRLAPRGEAAVEHSSRCPLAGDALRIDRTRRYGETTLTFLRSPEA